MFIACKWRRGGYSFVGGTRSGWTFEMMPLIIGRGEGVSNESDFSVIENEQSSPVAALDRKGNEFDRRDFDAEMF